MHLYRKIYRLALAILCLTVSTVQAHAGNDVSISGIDRIIAASSLPADPAVMVIVGAGLIALRIMIARKSRRREKSLRISRATDNESQQFTLSEPRTSSGTH